MTRRWLSLAIILMASAAVPASAEVLNMSIALSGANEVPAVQTPGTGTAAIIYNTDSRELRWEVQVQGLSAPATAAHFHGPAAATENAPVVVPIAKAGDQSPFKGSATLTPEQAAVFMAGRWYVNVHTSTHPPGEIRGQVVKK